MVSIIQTPIYYFNHELRKAVINDNSYEETSNILSSDEDWKNMNIKQKRNFIKFMSNIFDINNTKNIPKEFTPSSYNYNDSREEHLLGISYNMDEYFINNPIIENLKLYKNHLNKRSPNDFPNSSSISEWIIKNTFFRCVLKFFGILGIDNRIINTNNFFLTSVEEIMWVVEFNDCIDWTFMEYHELCMIKITVIELMYNIFDIIDNERKTIEDKVSNRNRKIFLYDD